MKKKDLSIAYTSRLLNKAEQNYSTIKKELFAIVYNIQFFRPYIYGRKFTLVTDHQPLKWLHSVKHPTLRLARLKLAEYEVVYKAGKVNANVDAFSRNPIPILLLKASEKTDPKKIPPFRRSLINFLKAAPIAIADQRKPSPNKHSATKNKQRYQE